MELRFPIRIYWDLTPVPVDRRGDPLAICEELLALKVLSVNLLDAGPALSRECLAILGALQGKPVAVTLTASPEALDATVRQRLQALRIKALFVSASSVAELRARTAAGWQWSDPAGLSPGICVDVGNTNYLELPELLTFCREQRITQLVLPIFRALHGASPSYPSAQGREWLVRELQAIDRAGLNLTIHDPFLWMVFFPDRPFPEGGCQAANSMLYIAPDASVYPCPILPFRLGTLGETSLAEIATSPVKLQLRKRLANLPADCRACAAAPQCRGGCRGRGFILQSSWDAADPACR